MSEVRNEDLSIKGATRPPAKPLTLQDTVYSMYVYKLGSSELTQIYLVKNKSK